MSKVGRLTPQAPVKHIWYSGHAHFQGWKEEGDSCCPTTHAQFEKTLATWSRKSENY